MYVYIRMYWYIHQTAQIIMRSAIKIDHQLSLLEWTADDSTMFLGASGCNPLTSFIILLLLRHTFRDDPIDFLF